MVHMTTLIADPCVAEIPVVDSGEPLIDVTGLGISHNGRTTTGRLVRAGVAQRLVAAQPLLPPGVRLLLMEGHRSAESQERLFTAYSDGLRHRFTDADDQEIRRLATRFVAPLEVAPHVAGAAVDIALVDVFGDRLPMGTVVDGTPEQRDASCRFDAPDIDPVARTHRTMLAHALTEVGLVNYPTEWWHWSFGDRYWAHITGADHALYGPVRR